MDVVGMIAEAVMLGLAIAAAGFLAMAVWLRYWPRVQLARQKRDYETPYEREKRMQEKRFAKTARPYRRRDLHGDEEAAVQRARDFLNR